MIKALVSSLTVASLGEKKTLGGLQRRNVVGHWYASFAVPSSDRLALPATAMTRDQGQLTVAILSSGSSVRLQEAVNTWAGSFSPDFPLHDPLTDCLLS